MNSRRNSCRTRLSVAGIVILMTSLAGTVWADGPDTPVFSEQARVSVRLRFLQRTWHRHVVERDPVHTQVDDAQVSGHQTTSVNVTLSSVTCPGVARLLLHGTGCVQSTTVGITPQAQVHSLGSHTFELTKPLVFDGSRFLTQRSYGRITARTQPIAVQTALSGLPLLGPLGEQIAWSETLRRQPRTNSIVVRQVADDVLPEFDEAVERQLASANATIAAMHRRVAGLFSGRTTIWRAESTSCGVTVKFGFQEDPGTVLTARPILTTAMKPEPQDQEDLVLSVSDRLLNDLVERLPLKHLSISDSALQTLASLPAEETGLRDLRDALARPARLFSLRLAEQIPVKIAFESGHIVLAVRFRVVPVSGPVGSLQRMTVRLAGADGGPGHWALRVRSVDVASEESGAGDGSLTELLQTQSRKMLLNQPPLKLPRRLPLQASTGLADLQLWQIRIRDGVLRAACRLAD